MTPTGPQLEIRPLAADDTRPLRQAILRPARPWAETAWPGDHDPDTRHFGAFDDGQLVAIASLYREDRPDHAGRDRGGGDGWRLRGMATAVDARGRGAGRALLAACVAHAAANGGGELWCNARTPAMGFYAGAGFERVSDQFDVPGIGPHVVMSIRVPPSP